MSEEYKDKTAAAENATEDAGNATDSAEDTGGIIPLNADKNATGRDAGRNAGVYVHKFKKPFEYEGKKYTTLNFYFERLTGKDMIAVENEMQANNEYAIDPLISRSFQSKMAARASGVAVDVLEAMPFQEFNRITTAARDFLIDTGY